ncbi:uncharacterized protein V1513DRAFT_485488 [Lipomyces chichibuensis]|uniref:uncharacterized protein n=1 Tax=Lipomyces chichibuensis TaxID=1546026 RepID=UPI00334416BD
MSTIHLSAAPQPDSDRSVPSTSLTVPKSPTIPHIMAESRSSPGHMSSPNIKATESTYSGVPRSLSPVIDPPTSKIAVKEGVQNTKRRPPSLVIDQSITALPSLHMSSNSSADSISSDSQKASPPSTVVSGKQTKSAKEIIQGLALHCVSPGLPPMNYEMLENVMRTKAIEKQQRQLIASRQKPVDESPDLSLTINSDQQDKDNLMEDSKLPEQAVASSGNESRKSSRNEDMNRMRMKVPAPQSQTREPRSAMKGRSSGYDKSASSVAETGRRAPRPASIRIVDPAKYQEGDYERAIRSAPLVNSMRMEYPEESPHNTSKCHQIDRRLLAQGMYLCRRPVSSPVFPKNRLTAQKSRYIDSLNDAGAFPVPHSAKPALSSAGTSLRARIHPELSSHTRRLSAHALPPRPEVYYSHSVFPYPPQKRAKHRREPQSTLQAKRPADSDCECEECRRATTSTGEELHNVRRQQMGEDGACQNRMKRQKYLELCAEMWDLFHETQ